jgi:protein-S-isoprenylcysteine O-methyltransferase Ste14
MERFRKWAAREYSKEQRLAAVILGGIGFWVVIPFFIIVGSRFFASSLHLPTFFHGLTNRVTALVFIIGGWLFANWTIMVQFSQGKGTPIPLMATQKLVVKRPYTYCRNPMALGTSAYYLGVAIGMGSYPAVVLALVYPVGMLIYIKLVEEKEMAERFGLEYLEYKRRTPFLIPRFWKRN